jgi:hypothetical protein
MWKNVANMRYDLSYHVFTTSYLYSNLSNWKLYVLFWILSIISDLQCSVMFQFPIKILLIVLYSYFLSICLLFITILSFVDKLSYPSLSLTTIAMDYYQVQHSPMIDFLQLSVPSISFLRILSSTLIAIFPWIQCNQ